MLTLLQSALDKRQRLALPPATDALRLVDGEGDSLPGIELETWAGRLLLATRDTRIHPELREWLHGTGQSVYHKILDPLQKSSPNHLLGPAQEPPFLVRERGVAFEASFHAGYSQGLFLDQRDNRRQVAELVRPGQTFLNTFAYTGAFSVVAALAGAETTTLDLAQPCLDWARRNFLHNSLEPATHHYCKGDTFHWLRRFAKQGRRFDAVVLDPPTFSRDDRGRVFRVESDATGLAALALDCLAPEGWILFCTNCRKLEAAQFVRRIRDASPRPLDLSTSPMPADFTAPAYLKSVWIRR